MKKFTKLPFWYSLLFALVLWFIPLSVMANQNPNQQITEPPQNVLSLNSEPKMLDSAQTLIQHLTILEQQITLPENSGESTDELTNWFSAMASELQALREQWQALQRLADQGSSELIELSADYQELKNLLELSEQKITSLERRLTSATQGVEDAIENWWHMETLLTEADQVITNWNNDYLRLQQQYSRARRGAVAGFTIGGFSFGVGVPLIIEGIRSDNSTMLWSGVGTIGMGALVWALGHYVFQWF